MASRFAPNSWRWLAAERIGRWITRDRGVEAGDVRLHRRRIYILPTRSGLVFAGAVLILLIGSINYGLQLGFLLTFLVASIAVVGMHETHANLVGLLVRGMHVAPVFAGDVASFEFVLTNPSRRPRHAIFLSYVLPRRRRNGRWFGREAVLPGSTADVAPGAASLLSVALPTRRRGIRPCPRVRIATRFPFGLFEAWGYITPDLNAIVYPHPEDDAPALPAAGDGVGAASGMAASGDEFAGVRPYQNGDSRRSIAWRLAARSDELSVKLFEASGGGEWLFDFAALSDRLDTEQKLSRLTRWVLMAESAQRRYGLVLPHRRIAIGDGPEHRARCLEALAGFPVAAGRPPA